MSYENKKSNKTTNKRMKEFSNSFMDQTENQIPIKLDVFPCRKCNKTFSLKMQARRLEKRSCKGKFIKSK